MKVAVAAENGKVSAHFGHCAHFVVAEIEEGSVVSRQTVENPGHAPGALPPFVAGLGATVIIAGGMGRMAIDLFNSHGVEALVGAGGSVDEVLNDFAQGRLAVGASACTEENHHH